MVVVGTIKPRESKRYLGSEDGKKMIAKLYIYHNEYE